MDTYASLSQLNGFNPAKALLSIGGGFDFQAQRDPLQTSSGGLLSLITIYGVLLVDTAQGCDNSPSKTKYGVTACLSALHCLNKAVFTKHHHSSMTRLYV